MMLLSPVRWLISNLGTLLLSFALAVVVWISAVTSSNPNVIKVRTVPIEIVGQDSNMLIVGEPTKEAQVTIRVPQDVWDRMSTVENALTTQVDVTGLSAGKYELNVQVTVNPGFEPARIIQVSPETIPLTLEPLESRTFPAKLDVIGEPATGYQKGIPARSPTFVTISGRESLVSQVVEVRATLDISDARDDIQTRLPLTAYDANGKPVNGVNISPSDLTVNQPISLLEAYRTVVVKPVTVGNVANGYKLTNISVSPPSVLVFSNDPQLVKDLPGYVETKPLDLSGAEDDIETFVELNLPEGVSVVDNSSVLVQVNIAAIEGGVTITMPVTPIGLVPGNAAEISPQTVDVILSGPVPVLNKLTSSDIRVVADVKNLDLGTHQVDLAVDVVPDKVKVESILPASVEVTIARSSTPAPGTPSAPAPGNATPPAAAGTSQP